MQVDGSPYGYPNLSLSLLRTVTYSLLVRKLKAKTKKLSTDTDVAVLAKCFPTTQSHARQGEFVRNFQPLIIGYL